MRRDKKLGLAGAGLERTISAFPRSTAPFKDPLRGPLDWDPPTAGRHGLSLAGLGPSRTHLPLELEKLETGTPGTASAVFCHCTVLSTVSAGEVTAPLDSTGQM